jgi:hypothetical protein
MNVHQLIRYSLATLTGTALLAICSSGSAQTAPSNVSDRSNQAQRCRELFVQGRTTIDEGKHDRARQPLSEAFAQCPSYDVAVALGQSELELKHYRPAAEHLDYAVRNFPPSESRELLAQIHEGLALAKNNLGTLRVILNHAGAEIFVDGRPAGVSPLEHELYVDPGRHSVRAAKEGFASAEQGIDAHAGQSHTVELKLNPHTELPDSRAGGSDTSNSSDPNPTIALIGVALTTAGAASAIGFYVASNSTADRVEELKRMHGAAGCFDPASAPPTCQEQDDAITRHNAQRDIAIGSAVFAGAVGVATALYWWRPWDTRERSGRAPPFRIRTAVGASGGIVSLASDFQ